MLTAVDGSRLATELAVLPSAFADAVLHPWSRLKIGRGQNVHDIDFDCCMPRLR